MSAQVFNLLGLIFDLIGFLFLLSSHFYKLFILLLHTDDLSSFLSNPNIRLVKSPKIRVNQLGRLSSDDIIKSQNKVKRGLVFTCIGIFFQIIGGIISIYSAY